MRDNQLRNNLTHIRVDHSFKKKRHMSHEYYAVILEFNPCEVKLGFAGEASEHVRLTLTNPLWKKMLSSSKSTSSLPAFLQLDSHAITPDARRELLKNINQSKPYRNMLEAFNRDKTDMKWYAWDLDSYQTLAIIVKILLCSRLLVSPLKSKMFVIDRSMSALAKSAFCKSFLGRKTAASVTFLPYSPCCCIGAGIENALVISLDWDSCKAVPVVDLRSISEKEFVQYSGESTHYSPAISHAVKSFEDVESEILESSTALEEALFTENCLPKMIAAIVETLELDCRANVVSNFIFTGLRSDVPGLKGRLLAEISSYLPSYNISGKICIGAWAGASLYCSTTLLNEKNSKWRHMEISRGIFDKSAESTLEIFNF